MSSLEAGSVLAATATAGWDGVPRSALGAQHGELVEVPLSGCEASSLTRLSLLPLDPHVRDRCEPYQVLSVTRMLRRMLRAMKYAAKEEHFAVVAGASVALILVGTLTYSLGEGWNVVDGFYFAVCTLTTSSIADPKLTLTHDALKVFTAIYVLTGIGILVELAREIGVGYVKEREERHTTRHARHHKEDPPETTPRSG